MKPIEKFLRTEMIMSNYTASERWKSQLEFYARDLNFLFSVLKRNTVFINSKKALNEAVVFMNELNKLKNKLTKMERDINYYMLNLKFVLVEDMDIINFDQNKECAKFESEISAFILEYDVLKSRIQSYGKSFLMAKKRKRLPMFSAY